MWGALCVLRAEKQSELLAGSSGHRGQGQLVTVPPGPISQQLVGVRQLGGPRSDDLGEVGREQTSPQRSL